MPWTYQQVNGWLDKDGILVSKDCYSGKFPDGFNKPEMESVKGVGPLPCGCYFIGRPDNPPEPHLGSYVMRLAPDPATCARILAMGRDPDSFRCHGKPLPPADIRAGSDGCLCADLPIRQRLLRKNKFGHRHSWPAERYEYATQDRGAFPFNPAALSTPSFLLRAADQHNTRSKEAVLR